MDKVMTAFFGLLIAALIAMVGFMVFLMADSLSLPVQTGSGTVTQKSYHAPYMSMVLISTGKTTVLVPQHHPARFSVCVLVAQTDEVACGNFPRTVWDQTNENDEVHVDYTSGRFTKGTYLQGISR